MQNGHPTACKGRESMKQKDYVVQAMRGNGGYSTLQQLYHAVNVSSRGTKTPQESIRRIVQQGNEFFKIKPGLWALEECRKDVMQKFRLIQGNPQSEEIFSHSFYQGMVVNIGNLRHLLTYVPPQDKKRKFLETPLGELTSVSSLQSDFHFSYDTLIRQASTVDAIWFNERNMPCAFYEIEHTTNIKNSLNKFYELQDFRAGFYIVAPKERKSQFQDVISASIYKPIRPLVHFVNYDDLAKQYEKESELVEVI